jgi:hypothetical protein
MVPTWDDLPFKCFFLVGWGGGNASLGTAISPMRIN